MQKDRIQLEDISAVAASSTAIIRPPAGPRYHDISLTFGNTAAADNTAPNVSAVLANLKVRYNGEDIWDLDAVNLDLVNTFARANTASQKYNGPAATAGTGRTQLTLFFADPTEDTGQDREILALPTDWLPSGGGLQVLVTLAAGVTPVLTANATVDYFTTGRPVAVMKLAEHDFNVSSNGITIVNQLPRTGLYSMLSLLNTSDGKSVTDATLKMGRVTRWDMTDNENTTKNLFNNMNPAAGAYHMVFGGHNGIVDYFDPTAAGDMSLAVTLSAAAAGTFTVVSQRYEMPKGF